MQTQNNSISFIIPCYNEEANIQKGVLDKVGNFSEDDARIKEVLIVDDGSSDSSKKIIKERYLKNYPKFRLIENKHMGKAFAIIAGIYQAKSTNVMFFDIDLATPLEEMEQLWVYIQKGYEIVIGSRTQERAGAPIQRKILAKGFIVIRNFSIGLKGIKDTQCGFKMFNTVAAKNILSKLHVFKAKRTVHGPSVFAGFDLEFLFVAAKLKYKIKEVPVIWRHVETKNVNFVKDAVETLKDIARIKLADIQGKYN
ncbi:glycosyltransferase [Candidatus Roizmanbacteria bacterium]|nr:glycosyltransferase [Candidatus Roizmanbacteria bacterium]